MHSGRERIERRLAPRALPRRAAGGTTLPDHTSLFKTFSNGPLARTDLEALYDRLSTDPPILSCSTGRTRSHPSYRCRLARLDRADASTSAAYQRIELMDGLLYLNAIESVASRWRSIIAARNAALLVQQKVARSAIESEGRGAGP